MTYRREDLGSLSATMAFADDLAELISHLQSRSVSRHFAAFSEGDPIANGFLELLASLQDGIEPLDAIVHAIAAWRSAAEHVMQAEAEFQKQREAGRARSDAYEEIARKVECPYCGSPPGAACRSTKNKRYASSVSHKGRWRLACHLNDGEPTDRDAPLSGNCRATAVSTGRRCEARALAGTPWCTGHGHPSGFPSDFTPDASMLVWALENAPSIDHASETGFFGAYWNAKRVRSAPPTLDSRDWAQIWRDWMRVAEARTVKAAGGEVFTGGYGSVRGRMLAEARFLSQMQAG